MAGFQCANPGCEAGGPRIETVDPSAVGMPPDVLARRAEGEPALRCSYCGFVWFKGWDERAAHAAIVPAGYYDAPTESGFASVPLTHPIRQVG